MPKLPQVMVMSFNGGTSEYDVVVDSTEEVKRELDNFFQEFYVFDPKGELFIKLEPVEDE